ncbi:16S rRNA (guanine(527)-N(7))-methyltransferase RsmG [Rhodobacteraceae bacterium CCMM004]|nr:16S rRNA (guanine(527)-N(7))-methyltransferase RsmG [Rhodobacteraceae bacterium CCMM004]
MDVSRETLERLRAYEAALARWTDRINLIGRSTRSDIWGRHILDSLQVAEHVPEQAMSVLDIGSGGGLPGIVLAILARAAAPERRVTLIDSDGRKCAFLRTVVRDHDLPANVIASRIEDLAPMNADCITARALASLDRLLDLAIPHSAPNCTFVFLKGARYQEEVDAARTKWDFALACHPSKTSDDGAILVLTKVSART